MITIRPKKSIKEWFLLVVFYLLVFQSPLERISSFFKYIDELFPFIGIIGIGYMGIRNGKIGLKKNTVWIIFIFAVFFTAGILGNIIYRYQPIEAVLIDLYTNFKFFFSIVSGYILFSVCSERQCRELIVKHARLLSVVFFVFLCVDVLFQVFPSAGERYGLRSVALFYGHSTYLAGTMVFLLTILLAFYDKINLPYIVFSLTVLISTLRGKALGGAFAFVLITYFLIHKERKIKPIHIAVMTVFGIIIGWDQIQYYFIDLSGESARSALMQTSIDIMRDYFPIGTGFGTYASASAVEYYSPVYMNYGLNYIWGLSEEFHSFGSDSFWPIIFGQTGVIGTICFVGVLFLLFRRVQKVRYIDVRGYATGLFAFAYIMICSTAEPAFHNSVSIPLAMMIGYIFTLEKQHG